MTDRYLSAEWFDAATTALAGATVPSDLGAPIRFGYTITSVPADAVGSVDVAGDDPGNELTVRYALRLDPPAGTAAVEIGNGDGDIRFTMTYSVAHSIACGMQNGSKAFLNGEVQLGGDVDLLIGRARDLTLLDGLLPSATLPDAVTPPH